MEGILRETPAIFPTTIRQCLANYRKQYKERRNAITLMLAFTDAVKYKRPIPKWIVNELNKVFRQYLYGPFEKEKDRSLDRLLGLKKGKGQSPATEEFYRWSRDIPLMTTMDMLIKHGISREDAAQIASERSNRQECFPTIGIDKTNQKYDEWKDKLSRITRTRYSESPKDIVQFVSMELRKKYSDIFLNKTLSNHNKPR